jgi:ABC-2 type transport system ATP-binding protein
MNSLALQTRSLCKTYGHGTRKIRAVDHLSLNVPSGSIYGLLGRNSAGKTTTIRMALGLARPTSGSVEVFGLQPFRDPDRVKVLQQVGYVSEEKTLSGGTPRRTFETNRAYYPDTWSDALARSLAERLELPLDTPALKLSLGNRTKAALITAIAQRSPLLILDEPTTGLDPIVLDTLLSILVEECTREGRTVFLSSHQLHEIERIADWIGIMDRGHLLLEGRLDDIRARFRRLLVSGAGLPRSGPAIISVRPSGHATEYILQQDPDAFTADLTRNGATILETSPLSLNDIFLELCRTRESKTEVEA